MSEKTSLEWMGTPEEKKKKLYLSQKRTLDTFLERGAITRAQYKKSLGDLTRLMGMEELVKTELPTTDEGEIWKK